MSYERLTERQDDGTVKYIGGDNDTLATAYEKLKYRLCELEENIKSGQAVILPEQCRVGAEVWYFKNPFWREPEKAKITGYNIEIPSNKIRVYLHIYLHIKNDSLEYEDDTRLEWTAKTKEAAEAKLKELRGE